MHISIVIIIIITHIIIDIVIIILIMLTIAPASWRAQHPRGAPETWCTRWRIEDNIY